jgi:secreted trypsin-like serine protease
LKNNKWIVTGIVSWGLKTCASAGLPGVYSKVSYYRYWIDEQVATVSIFGMTCVWTQKGKKPRAMYKLFFVLLS